MSDLKNKSSDVHDSTLQQENDFQFVLESEMEDAEPSLITQESNLTDPIKEKKQDTYLYSFMQEMENFSHPEGKIKHALAFMENSLSQSSGTPHFRSFWEVRHICLQLFKENLPPILRTQFWEKYSDLSKEARRLKEILDEQSSFAAEQIEKAIAALEEEIVQFEEGQSKLDLPDLSYMPKIFEKKIAFYEDIQKRLNFLNVQASRINSLRKELIKTEMRVRQKNKFFQKLSLLGDKIFPLRKDLIKEISATFTEDVETFVKSQFTKNFQESLFILRDEIKGLQSLAKILTLNTQAFTHTRMYLSECWDKIKFEERERKKERAQLKAVFKQNFDAVHQKILEFKKSAEEGKLSGDQAYRSLDEITKFMRQIELGRDEVKVLREELSLQRNLLQEKTKAQEQIRHQQEQDQENQRKMKINELKHEIEEIAQKIPALNKEELMAVRDELIEKTQNVSLNKVERQEIERFFKPIRSSIIDALSEKEEETLLSLSDDDRHALEQLKEVLKQRKERRQEIKDQLHKAKGTSGLNIEKAMAYNELMNTEKERLEKINQGIREIEDKIARLQKKR